MRFANPASVGKYAETIFVDAWGTQKACWLVMFNVIIIIYRRKTSDGMSWLGALQGALFAFCTAHLERPWRRMQQFKIESNQR